MVIGNANVFVNGEFRKASVTIDGDKIVYIGAPGVPCDVDAEGKYLVPGFVDIHTHGAMNEDFSDGKQSGLTKLSRYYAKNGVTSFVATTMTLKEETLLPAMKAIRNFRRPQKGAKCAGIHMEGPFLSYAKRGAQAAENLHAPNAGMFHRLNKASGNRIRLVTVAPEEPGAMEFIREISKICTVSLGHTMADYDTAISAFEAGASHATHLFNGMPPFLHRAPGVVGAAFDCGATVELICDGLHIHPSAVRVAHQMFGKNFVAVSDSLRCAGMPDGQYELGGQPIEMNSGKATLLGTDTLAGSSTNLLEEVRNLVRFGISLEAAITAVSTAPAKAICAGWRIGKIAPGYEADFLLLTHKLDLSAVYIDGEQII